MKLLPHTQWTFTMVTDIRDKDTAHFYSREAEIKRLRESRDRWKELAIWATVGFMGAVLMIGYYGLKG